jgi:hypothetical protein
MTLSELSLPMPYGECQPLALVYPYEVAAALYEIQQGFGDPRHVCVGRELTDGRWMIGGEVLSEVGPDGLYWWLPGRVGSELMASIEVVPRAEAEALLPAAGA